MLSLPLARGEACVGALGSGFAPERFHDLSNGLLCPAAISLAPRGGQLRRLCERMT